MIKLKRKYKGTVLTLKAGVMTGLPFDVSFDTRTTEPEDYADLYDNGFSEAFELVDDVGASEIIRSGYLK